MKQKYPLVSVVIPVYNSGRTLEKTLQSIAKQTYPAIEIIVADGGSIDNTLSIAKQYGAKICFGKELGQARFAGLKKSKGTFILAFDSDMLLDSRAIAHCITLMNTKKYQALILNEQSIVGKGTFIEKLLAADKWVVNTSKDADPIFGAAIPRFFYRKDLLHVAWPTSISILDDAVLFKNLVKKSNRVGFAINVKIIHHEVTSLKVFFKKFIRYGRLYFPTLQVSADTIIFHSLPRRAYFSKRVLSNPKLVFNLSILYLIKGSAVLTGILLYLFDEGKKRVLS